MRNQISKTFSFLLGLNTRKTYLKTLWKAFFYTGSTKNNVIKKKIFCVYKEKHRWTKNSVEKLVYSSWINRLSPFFRGCVLWASKNEIRLWNVIHHKYKKILFFYQNKGTFRSNWGRENINMITFKKAGEISFIFFFQNTFYILIFR